MTKIIKEKDGYTLYRPMHSWDTNYHLVDSEDTDYLIDTSDVYDDWEDVEEYGGMLWSELKELECIETVKDNAWKITTPNDTIMLQRKLDRILMSSL